MKSALVPALLLGATLMTACSDEEPTIDRTTAEAVLEANVNTASEVEAALDRVAKVCMEDQGFEIHPPDIEVEENPSIRETLRREVYTDPDPAASPEDIYGIGLFVGTNATYAEVGNDGELTYLADPGEFSLLPLEEQEDYFEAFYGTVDMEVEALNLPDVGAAERSGGGCLRKAEDALAEGEYPDYLNHAGLAGAKGGTSWASDDRVYDARIEWSICMAAADYTYEEPLGLYLDLVMQAGALEQEAFTSSESRTEELRTEFGSHIVDLATVDHACHNETSLQDIQEDVYWEYLIAYVSGQEEEFYSFQERAEHMLTIAQDIIAAGTMQS